MSVDLLVMVLRSFSMWFYFHVKDIIGMPMLRDWRPQLTSSGGHFEGRKGFWAFSKTANGKNSLDVFPGPRLGLSAHPEACLIHF